MEIKNTLAKADGEMKNRSCSKLKKWGEKKLKKILFSSLRLRLFGQKLNF
jgi:hypothetical protein